MAKRLKLLWVRERDGDEWSDKFLARDEGYFGGDGVIGKADDADINQMAEFCDHEAENGNYHGLVGMYGQLTKIMIKEGVDADAARRVMQHIAELGGIHEQD